MKALEHELKLLLQYGNLGYYSFCNIVQVVLFSDTHAINYYTNIEFSSEYKLSTPFNFLTKKGPILINDDYKLAISKYTIAVEQFIQLYCTAAKTGIWKYDGKEVIIDDAFVTDKKFVPENDPTGGQYNMFVPLEYGLYGSNFIGNYYIHEIFSKKTLLNVILEKDTIQRIQAEINKCNLNFRLDKLEDRIGNVVCKFSIEVLIATPKLLGEYGIEYEFKKNKKEDSHKYCLHVVQEHDGLIYKNRINNEFDCSNVKVNPNQCKTTISVLDITTGLTLFYGQFDYSVYSNYHSQITPPTIIAQGPGERILHFNDHDEIVALNNVQMMGTVYNFLEMEYATQRKIKLDDEWLYKQGYLKAYTQNQHETAIQDIVGIINNNMLWDLHEIWMVDPYLNAEDLILTALRCKKEGIIVRALCAYSAIHSNKETKDLINASKYEAYRQSQYNMLHSVLGDDNDIKLEYRTIRNGHGMPFHDRYIMLKYTLNRCRVWSLGASINSIGRNHSIIQIVEAPETLISLFEELWIDTDNDECILFST